jgi:hypothetical protein
MFENATADSILREALKESQRFRIEQVENETKANQAMHVFSREFEKRMEKLLKMSAKPYFRYVSTIGKRVALIAVTFFIALSITTFSVDAIRTPVINFLAEVYETFTSLMFGSDDVENVFPETIEDMRTPENIPGGYTASEPMDMGILIQITYSATGKDEILFEQYIISSTVINMDTEGVDLEKLMINDCEAFYYENKGQHVLVWTDGQYGYSLTGNINKNVLISMTKLKKDRN